MQMKTILLIFFGLLIIGSYIAAMTAIGIVSYQAKLKSVSKYFNNAENRSNNLRTIKRPSALMAFILFWIGFLCVGACLATVIIGKYFGVLWITQLDSSVLRIILGGFIVFGIVAVLIGSIVYPRLFRFEE